MATSPRPLGPKTDAEWDAIHGALERSCSNDDPQALAEAMAAANPPILDALLPRLADACLASGSRRCMDLALSASSDPRALCSAALVLRACFGLTEQALWLCGLCDPNEPQADAPRGQRPLALAAHFGHADTVAALLPLSDADARDKEGRTALMAAAVFDDESHHRCLATLLSACDPWLADPEGATALDQAARAGALGCALILLGAPGLTSEAASRAARLAGRGPEAQEFASRATALALSISEAAALGALAPDPGSAARRAAL